MHWLKRERKEIKIIRKIKAVMQTYKLHTLLLFFKAQQKLKFEAIEIILGIFEDTILDDDEKKDGILFILSRYGLNELTCKNGDYVPKLDSCILPIDSMRELDCTNYKDCFMVEALRFKILNGDFIYEVGLN